jgi:hypothetical protein
MTLFDAIRNLIDVRFTGTHAIHGLVHKQTRRICAVSNFNISPKTVMEKSGESFTEHFEPVYNLQKIINLNESLRPKIRARQAFPVNFIYQNDFIFEDHSPVQPDMVSIAELASEKVAAVDFVARFINEMRRPYNSVALFLQQKIYAAKATEAERIMKQVRRFERNVREEPPNEELLREANPYVSDYADEMKIGFFEAAKIIEDKSREESKALTCSEHERIRMYREIGSANNVEALRLSVKEFITRNNIVNFVGNNIVNHDHNHDHNH